MSGAIDVVETERKKFKDALQRIAEMRPGQGDEAISQAREALGVEVEVEVEVERWGCFPPGIQARECSMDTDTPHLCAQMLKAAGKTRENCRHWRKY